MGKAPSRKAKIICWILVHTFAVIFVLIGFVQLDKYKTLKGKYTAQVTGTVIYEGFGKGRNKTGNTDPKKTKYVTSKYWRQIKVESDGVFTLNEVYDNRGAEKKGDKISIYYEPDNPDNYYIGDYANKAKDTAIAIFVATGVMILLYAFIMIKSGNYYKKQAQKNRKYIYFDTRYCRFTFVEGNEMGYEGEVEWNYNKNGENVCTVFFDTDTTKVPKKGYYGLVEINFLGKEPQETDYDINKLSQNIPELRAIQPGRCYDRLEKILSDKQGRDYEIRKMVADHFVFKTDLVKKNATEQELMDGIELSYIGVERNGDTRFGIFFADDIYVDDLCVILKEDGTKEIHYKVDDNEHRDVL